MTRPAHLFLADNGDLYDTRTAYWSLHPLRRAFAFSFAEITTAAQVKATLRAGPYTWPGAYPLYFITADGGALSFDAVRDNLREVLESLGKRGNGWNVTACIINHEDSTLLCDHTGKRIESAYDGEDAA